MVDSGLTIIEVTNQNLYQAYVKYGINTTGVIIIESKYTSDLKCGDKITHLNGIKVSSADEMKIILKTCKVGDVVTVTVERSGGSVKVELTLEEKVPDSVSFG